MPCMNAILHVKIAQQTTKAQSVGAQQIMARTHLNTHHYTAGDLLPHIPAGTHRVAAGKPPAAPGLPPHAPD